MQVCVEIIKNKKDTHFKTSFHIAAGANDMAFAN